MLNKSILLTLLALMSLAGCASNDERPFEEDEDAGKNASMIYREARNALDKGDYESAIERLEALEARFPFGVYAQQAQLDMAYAYYKFEEPEAAISSADRFIKLYPRHPRVDYAYYLRGVIKFQQVHSFFDEVAGQDPASRDSGSARMSFQYFSELIERFPDSPYAQDATQRMYYLRNTIARSELLAARYYMKLNSYVAAANRAKYIVENLYQTPSVPEALAIMATAYRHLQLNDLAQSAEKVLKLNFPEHEQTQALVNKG